jgi:putative tryptophan/tyrosine transport system substrate-binding protein
MRARFLLSGVAAAILFSVHVASAQDTRVPRVGVILQGGPWYAIVEGLRDGLRELGLVEGKQFVLDIRDTRGDLKAVEEAAKNFEQQKVNLIYTAATSVSLAAKGATKSIPIIFVAGTNPVTVKLVESIPAPGGRLTGVYFRATDLMGKRLELLREIVPNLRRVMTFYNPSNGSAIEAAKEAREAARNLGLDFIERQVASVDDLQKALQAYRTGEADAFVAVSDAMIDSQIQSVIDMAKAKSLPTMLYEPSSVLQGGLSTYSADFNEIGRLSAKYVQRVLAGENPALLAVESVDRLMFVINLKTAKQIGLKIPESILLRADKVIE